MITKTKMKEDIMYEEDGCNNVNVSNGCRNVDRMRGIGS